MSACRHFAINLITLWVAVAWLNLPASALAERFKPGEVLVKFRDGISSSDRAGLQGAAKARQVKNIGLGNIQRITLSQDMSVEQAVAIYANHPDVLFAEPNYRIQPQVSPNDPDFGQQWGLNNIGQVVESYVGTPGSDLDTVRAWDITNGSDTVIVAVVDTGCDYNHPDLAANIWINTGEIADNGIDDDGNGFIDDYHGWDFSANDADPQDGTGHGTHVAGVIAARGNNGLGVSGVAWQARIMPVRFIDTFNTGYTDNAIEAIRYAVANGARIINCSWGTSEYSTALRDEMANTDALFVCAAGNSAVDTDISGFYPAGYDADNIIAVAASDQMDRLTYFSNYGINSVDVAAPGIRIYSLQQGRQTIWQNDFSDRGMDDWTTGGVGDSWAVDDPPATVDEPALATSPSDNYADNADMWARIGPLDLSVESAPELALRLIGLSEADADHLFVEASDNGTDWSQLPVMLGGAVQAGGISGTIPYWMPVTADLNAWEHYPQIYLRMHFQSNGSVNHGGFYLDDFELTTAAAQNTYTFMEGTSMAAAFVSGLAALLLSQDEALTVLDLKTIILNSVDVDLDLADLLVSGGRINALHALMLLDDLSLSASPSAADRITLSWFAGAPLDTQVVIERRSDGQTEFETVAQVSAAETQYEDSNLAPESTYCYRVQTQMDGRSGYSNQTLATTLEQASQNGGDDGGGGGCFINQIAW